MNRFGALVVVVLVALTAAWLGSDAHAQVRAAAITAPIVVTVNGSPVTLTADDKEAIARASAAVRAALPTADREQVDWQTALTAAQRLLVGSDGPEQWVPAALIARWKAAGGSVTKNRAAEELEIALIARRVVAERTP